MPASPPIAPQDRALSVGELNRLAREVLEHGFPLLRIVGEVSNLARPASGHLYFTLKDDSAQVRCTMWRSRAHTLPFRLDNGMRVEARATVTLYEARGDFQLAVDALRPGGTGDLYEAFLRLRDRLRAEGLFDDAAKRPLPRYPRRIGVVTSTAAAALQDVLVALERRAPCIHVVLYPSVVQGDGAGNRLTEAVSTASRRAAVDGIDALLLVRGGGSLEDLWAFNDEGLARAIRACPVPVISGIGHETDVTIADLAADLRAPTPTAAAELVSADYHAARSELDAIGRALRSELVRRVEAAAQRLDRAAMRLVHPRERLARSAEQLERLREALVNSVRRRNETERLRCATLALRLRNARPRIDGPSERHARLRERLDAAVRALLERRRERLAALSAQLTSLSPQATLARGFSIVRDPRGNIVREAAQLAAGALIAVELGSGSVDAQVTATRPGPGTGLS
jgi:exodeoxyribonuclease VII large subunit